MRGLSFYADGEFFTVDVTLVQKVARNMTVTPVPSAPDSVVGITNLKGRVVTILNLSALLGQSTEKAKKAAGIYDTEPVRAIVFKPFSDGDDQMGLLIDRPGNLTDIDEDKIMPLSIKTGKTGAAENLCLSGIAEIEGQLYRIIDVNSIINYFKHGGENHAGIDITILKGGTDQ